jgi:predicted membrane protein
MSSSTTANYAMIAVLANIAFVLLAAVVFIILKFRFCSKLMKKPVKPNEILKKFDKDGAKHLRLNEEELMDKEQFLQDIEEKRALLEASIESNQIE